MSTEDESVEDAKLVQEFEILAERAGLVIPPERRAGVFAQFKDLREMIALLHRSRSPADEPAGIYRVETIMRGLA
jgi:hypothetical protein